MNGAHPISLKKFGPGEACSLISIGRETFRHWQGVVPALALRRGQRPLSAQDILGLMVMREAVKTLGVNVSVYPLAFSQLFDALAKVGDPLGAPPGFALISPRGADLINGLNATEWTGRTQAHLVVPLASLARELSSRLTDRSGQDDQRSLDF